MDSSGSGSGPDLVNTVWNSRFDTRPGICWLAECTSSLSRRTQIHAVSQSVSSFSFWVMVTVEGTGGVVSLATLSMTKPWLPRQFRVSEQLQWPGNCTAVCYSTVCLTSSWTNSPAAAAAGGWAPSCRSGGRPCRRTRVPVCETRIWTSSSCSCTLRVPLHAPRHQLTPLRSPACTGSSPRPTRNKWLPAYLSRCCRAGRSGDVVTPRFCRRITVKLKGAGVAWWCGRSGGSRVSATAGLYTSFPAPLPPDNRTPHVATCPSCCYDTLLAKS